MNKFKLLTLAAGLAACGLGVSGAAQANAYAVVTDGIKNGFLTALVNGKPQVTNGPALVFGTPASSSTSSATLNGTGTTSNNTTPPPDANASVGTGSNPGRTNEQTFTLAGNTYYTLYGQLPTAYSWGDAKVVSEQSLTGSPVEARNAAESNIPVSGSADANGQNSSSTAFTATITAGTGCAVNDCRLNFSFLADPYMQTVLDALAGGTVARGALSLVVTVKLVGALNNSFVWAPDGNIGTGILGGTETADSEDLNQVLQSLSPGVTETFSGPYGAGVYLPYSATTDRLAPGNYTIGLTMTEHTDVKRVVAVPEPASLALIGLGLGILGLSRRRKGDASAV